jgi:hypothetical protein
MSSGYIVLCFSLAEMTSAMPFSGTLLREHFNTIGFQMAARMYKVCLWFTLWHFTYAACIW